MTLLKTIAITLALFGGGLALANNFQDDPICATPDHTGYTLEDGTALPAPSTFNPAAPLPFGMENAGQFETDFDCTVNPAKTCHYVYIPASGGTPAKWVECSGDIRELN